MGTIKALTLIEDYQVENGVPSTREMQVIRATLHTLEVSTSDPVALAHNTLTTLGWHVATIDGAIYEIW